jgi:hypothetical protein
MYEILNTPHIVGLSVAEGDPNSKQLAALNHKIAPRLKLVTAKLCRD